jgi:release factor glutamine methyltransferase
MFIVESDQLWQWRSRAMASAIALDVDLAEIDWLLLELSDLDRLALRLGRASDRASVGLRIAFDDLETLWEKRITDRVPVQYLVGHSHWRQFTLQVSPAVLIPRPETELIIDLVQAAVSENPALADGIWLDLGTGSGAIAIGLADALPNATIHAVDISSGALAIAQANAKKYHFDDRIQFHQGAWAAPIQHLAGQVAGLISNPPYIPTPVVATLEPEVQQHEPQLALDGGADGLEAIRHLVQVGELLLQPQGFWLVEMMAGQGEAVQALLQQSAYERIRIEYDLAGHDRFCSAYKPL